MEEPNQRKHKASESAPQDFISHMPDNVVTNILDRLPLQDALKTSILARDWWFKWTLLSQLVSDLKFFMYLLRLNGEYNYGKIISRLLLHIKGTITKFVLYIEERSKLELDDEDINHWIMLLSTKGIKDLTIWNLRGRQLMLSTHLFSCLELKRLQLISCSFDPPASFHGFPNLLSLDFIKVEPKRGNFEEFITRCPLLETLKINISSLGKVKLVEIAKLANLKVLSLPLCNLDTITSTSGIFELVGSLPQLEELDLNFGNFKFTNGAAKKRSPTSFPCLRDLQLRSIDLANGTMLSCAFELIRCSPNAQTLDITENKHDADPPTAILEAEYNTMELLQLRSVVFRSSEGLENEVCLIEYILACSPFLKKIVIHPDPSVASGEKLFTRKLLKLPRASPVAVIDVY